MVDVDKQHGAFALVPGSGRECMLKTITKQLTVGGPGEGVIESKLLDFVFGFLDVGDVERDGNSGSDLSIFVLAVLLLGSARLDCRLSEKCKKSLFSGRPK